VLKNLKVYENEETRAEVLRMLRGYNKPYAPNHWHVSKLVCCQRAAYFWWTGTPWQPEDMDAVQLLFSRGKAHHYVLEVYPNKNIEIWKDNVVGHVDMRGDRPVEIFTTTVGLNRVQVPLAVPQVFTMKVNQLKCYLHMLNESSGDLMVFYLFGDYSRPIKPELKVYTMEFEEEQLRLHWKYRLTIREKIMLLANLDEVPDETGEFYECINCGYKYKCIEFLQERRALEAIGLIERIKDGEVILE